MGWYDGKTVSTMYLTQDINPEQLIMFSIGRILIPKYHNYTIYIHNLKMFDVHFLIKAIGKTDWKTNVIMDDNNNIISLKLWKYNKSWIHLKLKDSLLLLNTSLYNLGKQINTEYRKDNFPYSFMTSETIYYKGVCPPDKYWNKPPKNRVQIWDARVETLKYLENDLKTLYEVINKYADEIFKKYQINITDHNTISSLSLKIFQSNFYDMSKNTLQTLTGISETQIRHAYRGGMVMVNKREIEKGYLYDVNSLYPYAMLNPMPMGHPELSNDKELNNYFGFVYVEVSPPNTNIPILPTPIEYKEGQKFKGWYFSEELKNAQKYGYKIKLFGGYKFKKQYKMFDTFVKTFYQMKVEGDSTNRMVAKTMLNSLYGRLGMKEQYISAYFVNKKDAEQVLKNKEAILEWEYDNKMLIRTQTRELSNKIKNKLERPTPASIQIAAAITAYARIFMSKYIQKSHYTDTDSIVVSKPLPKREIGVSCITVICVSSCRFNILFPRIFLCS